MIKTLLVCSLYVCVHECTYDFNCILQVFVDYGTYTFGVNLCLWDLNQVFTDIWIRINLLNIILHLLELIALRHNRLIHALKRITCC